METATTFRNPLSRKRRLKWKRNKLKQFQHELVVEWIAELRKPDSKEEHFKAIAKRYRENVARLTALQFLERNFSGPKSHVLRSIRLKARQIRRRASHEGEIRDIATRREILEGRKPGTSRMDWAKRLFGTLYGTFVPKGRVEQRA